MRGEGGLELDIAASPCLALRQPTSRVRMQCGIGRWSGELPFGDHEVECVIHSHQQLYYISNL